MTHEESLIDEGIGQRAKRNEVCGSKTSPSRRLGINDVLVRVHYTAFICGTDVHIYEWEQWGAKERFQCRWRLVTNLSAKWSRWDRM